MKRSGLFALCLVALMTVTGCASTSVKSSSTNSIRPAREKAFRQAIYRRKAKKIAKLIDKSTPEENVEGLLMAATKDAEAVKLFLDAGIDVNSVGRNGKTPLLAACSYYVRHDVVELLLEKGAKVNSVDDKGRTPLILACTSSFNEDDTIKLLLENGANVNSADNDGRTALYYAINSINYYAINDKRKNAIQLLIQFGADVNAQYNGKSLLFIAQELNNDAITKLLRDAGAEFTSADRQSSTNFYNQVIYQNRNGIPLENGDSFTIRSGRIQVVDRLTDRLGYTYLVTFYSDIVERVRDYSETFSGGGIKYCFYIVSKRAMTLRQGYDYTTKERYITSANDLKLTCTGTGKYQRNYQDVDCYIFTLDEEM